MEYLFVYGTLRPGEENDHHLTKMDGQWEKGRIFATLKRPGEWGGGVPYPGVILDNSSSSVEGYVFSSHDLSNHWQDLDDFEGEKYQRALVEVEKEDGSKIEAHVYVIRNP